MGHPAYVRGSFCPVSKANDALRHVLQYYLSLGTAASADMGRPFMGVRVAACLVIAIAVVQAADQGMTANMQSYPAHDRCMHKRLDVGLTAVRLRATSFAGICHEWDYRGILGRSSDQRLEFAGEFCGACIDVRLDAATRQGQRYTIKLDSTLLIVLTRRHARPLRRASAGLPGFMRSVHKPSYALITPESRVWAPLVGW